MKCLLYPGTNFAEFWPSPFLCIAECLPLLYTFSLIPRQEWLSVPSFHLYSPQGYDCLSVCMFISKAYILFSCKKWEACSRFSYSFVSIFSQSCIYNPTGTRRFRWDSLSTVKVCYKIDPLAKLCDFFKTFLAFILGKRKTEDTRNQQQLVLPT